MMSMHKHIIASYYGYIQHSYPQYLGFYIFYQISTAFHKQK